MYDEIAHVEDELTLNIEATFRVANSLRHMFMNVLGILQTLSIQLLSYFC